MHFKDMNGFKKTTGRAPIVPHLVSAPLKKSRVDACLKRKIFIDAGIEHLHVCSYHSSPGSNFDLLSGDIIIPNNDDIRQLFKNPLLKDIFPRGEKGPDDNDTVYITGKLAEITQKALPQGETILPAAVLWSAAKFLFSREDNQGVETIGIIDLSASGYMVICVNKHGELQDDLLVVNPRCGAGSGVNLNRILEKLAVRRDKVDRILGQYLGPEGKIKRLQVPVRSDRCGVFSSSAAVSDKNQGIPLDYALAVTMKSEVLKPCNKMPANTHKVYLSGGVFRWQYARDCAEDILKANNIKDVVYDKDQSLMIAGMKYLVDSVGAGNFRRQNPVRLRKTNGLKSLPAFKTLKENYEAQGLYQRLPDPEPPYISAEAFVHLPVNIGLDIGSTMAKIVISHANTGSLLFFNSFNNHGDTIETIKHIFRQLKARGINRLKLQNLGITGSGRYQVQKALKAIYPHLQDRIFVMVENYAHAWGSISFAREHIARLKQQGIDVNEEFCLLIDIGGEDTKISVISLKKEELFDNAMNIKCSAGTGSLMDTLNSLFNIGDIAGAYGRAFAARKAYAINATCAVFLMENARKMQAEGYPKDDILASCCYAIVENMARSLWNQVDFPRNTVVLLHGQTMRSDPLPLAVTHRVQEYIGSKGFCLVPPLPGHRACIGLVKHLQDKRLAGIDDYFRPEDLLECRFERKMIECRGAACGDSEARCGRTMLKSADPDDKVSLTLGGCTAVNELQARLTTGSRPNMPNAYNEIRKFISLRLPKSQDNNRLVIPRCFSLSERAYFFGKLCERLGLPVHIDDVQASDILEGQPYFTIDTCAPGIGAAGQFLRLARESHGIILVPQIDFLPIEGESVGRTCTSNQGGLLVALHLAQKKYPPARFRFFDVSLKDPDPQSMADQLFSPFQSIFKYYNLKVSRGEFALAMDYAANAFAQLKTDTADIAADFIQQALHKKINISIVSAREYVLNPGIYDSHIGKLLYDKGVAAIPIYVFDAAPDRQFDFIYWKNSHDLMTKANAIANHCFHRIIKHPRLQELIKQIETGHTGSQLSLVTVSTFRCGPDSITLPVLAEVTKNVPSLLIQSDAMIAELAHLENRVNTYLNQLNKRLHFQLGGFDRENFSFYLLDEFRLDQLSKKTDVLYFPTMNDNRGVTSVFRGAGFTVIDNFADDSYHLEEKVKNGRKYVGDSLCAPLAAVLSDMLQAVEDFRRRKQSNDPMVNGKERVVLFMHSGDGPCRQGQYIDICKLILYQKFRAAAAQRFHDDSPHPGLTRFPIKFLANIATDLHERMDFLPGVENRTMIRGLQGFILKELLLEILLKGSCRCKNSDEYREFYQDYLHLKKDLYQHLEQKIIPGKLTQLMLNKVARRIPGLSGLSQYFGYGLYNNIGLREILKKFYSKWLCPSLPGKGSSGKKLSIHVDGEVYLRAAQIHEILKTLIDSLGFGSFELQYSPVWAYFEYILGTTIYLAEKDIALLTEKLKEPGGSQERAQLKKLIKEKKHLAKDTRITLHRFIEILVRPLYKAAGIDMPHPVESLFSTAQPVLPTLKPTGELIPYVGEAISRLNEGIHLLLNVAPEGCMVASMGEMLSSPIMRAVTNKKARIQHLFTTDGEVNEDLLRVSLLKVLGPEGYYLESDQARPGRTSQTRSDLSDSSDKSD